MSDPESATASTGLIYSESMADYHCLWDPSYVEKPERFTRVLERFREYGLPERCLVLTPRKATQEELERVHGKELVEFMKSTKEVGEIEVLKKYSSRWEQKYYVILSEKKMFAQFKSFREK